MSDEIIDLSRRAMGANECWEIAEANFWRRVLRWLGLA